MIQAARRRIAMERLQELHLATEEDILCTNSRSIYFELDPKSNSVSPAASDNYPESGRGASCNCHHREASCLRCSSLRRSLHARRTRHQPRRPHSSIFSCSSASLHPSRAPSCASGQLCGASVWYHPQEAEDSRSMVEREECTLDESSRRRASRRCRTPYRGLRQ